MDLKSKLGMYKSAEGQKQSAARGEKGGEVKLPGIVVCNDDGDIFVLENRYPISYLYGGSRLGDALDINPKYLEWMNGKIESGKRSRTGTARAEGTKGKEQAAGSDVFPGAGRLLFLDTETTGLSGGAGTVAFLTGVGFFRGDEFVVRQYFMRDYDEEPAMLNELNQLLSSFDGLVTFNGRSFDWNLLYGRFIQNRIKPSVKEPVNLDLLFPARRIWSLKLESCRLSSLEENILSEYRSDDIPGALIPAVYFKYLEDGDVSEIKRVIRHNGLDVLSMVALMIKIAGMLENPMLDEPDHDLIGVGRILQAGAEFCAQAGHMECFEACARAGDYSVKAAAIKHLTNIYKKDGSYEKALVHWESLAKESKGFNPGPFIEMAKYYEHKAKDCVKALEIVEQAIADISETMTGIGVTIDSLKGLEDLKKRRARLVNKISRRL